MILERPNRARVGVFSLAEHSPTGHDRDYLAWHLLDHLPEQYRIDGVLFGQRWVSTPACRAARADAAAGGSLAPVDHVTHYLFGPPVDAALDDFLALGAELAGLDRYPTRLPSAMLANFEVAAVAAAPRVRVSPEAIPFRPNRGAYLVAEPAVDGVAAADHQAWTLENLAQLVAVDGVAGAWRFTPGSRRPDRFDARGLSLTICYLDAEPAEVAAGLERVLVPAWKRWGIRPELAGPFETVRPPWA